MDQTRTALADAARRALRRPAGAQLLVDGLSPSGGGEPHHPDRSMTVGVELVELVERHGTPLLLCDPAAPLAGAGRRGRCATLSVASQDGVHRVTFRGQLTPAGREVIEDREVELVELRLTKVLVRPEGPAGAPDLPVPLADYHAEHDTGLASYAGAVLAHTNTAHAVELREYAARLAVPDLDGAGEPRELVAGAWLDALDTTGIDLGWIDAHGAHRARVLFARPAHSCAELGDLLRCTLCGRA